MDPRVREQTRRRIEWIADSADDVLDLFHRVTAALRRAVPVDGWCGLTLDPASLLPTAETHREGLQPALFPRLLDLEYRVGDVNAFPELVRQDMPAGVLHERTGDHPEVSARYRDVIVPSGFEHEMRLLARASGRAWGGFVFLRAADSPPFGPDEQDFVADLSRTLASGVRRTLVRSQVSRGTLRDEPGLVLLDEAYEIDAITPAAERWLADLSEPSSGGARLPLSVYALAAQALHDPDGTAIRARGRTRAGRWITLRAWRLGPAPVRVAVTIEPARPQELAAVVLDAYGLSDRERQVTELALLGHSTSEIAKALFLSPYTVQDHLKAVFDKTGVRSRRELAAELFFRHYLPRIERGLPLDATGWFDEIEKR